MTTPIHDDDITTHADAGPAAPLPDEQAPAPPNGPAAAAILAAGIGSFALGLLIVLSTVSTTVKDLLTFSTSVGPLSGKTAVTVVIWLISWVVLHHRWRERSVPFNKIYALALILILLGLIGSFPPVFEALEH